MGPSLALGVLRWLSEIKTSAAELCRRTPKRTRGLRQKLAYPTAVVINDGFSNPKPTKETESMLRSVLAVILGYIAMFAMQFAVFMTVYTIVGANWSFKPGTYHASTRWTVMMFTVDFVTAVIAGLICAIIARGGKAPLVLAVVALAIGVTLGALHIATEPPDTGERRPADVPNMTAMTKARHPVWVFFVGPVIAAVGIAIGGQLRRKTSPGH